MANKGIPTAEARRLIREQGPEMLRRYEAGESFAAIARSYGVSKAATANAVKRLGGVSRRGSHSTPGLMERAQEVRRRYESGEELREIGADLGVSWTTVRGDLIAVGGVTRQASGFKARPLRGPENPAWRGGAHLNKEGYRLVWVAPDHPFAVMRSRRGSYVFEHRLVMAEALGRPLAQTETVHHINGDRLDNRLENLQLRGQAHGPGVNLRCRDCGSQNIHTEEI